jgi:hypothetical protein
MRISGIYIALFNHNSCQQPMDECFTRSLTEGRLVMKTL